MAGSPDLSEVVNDPELAEPFIILRGTSGAYSSGGWTQKTTTIQAYGVVTVADAKEIEAIPEADRIHEVRAFYTSQQLFITNAANGQTSDILQWQGINYRIVKEPDYNNRGYWKALATRMVGD